EALSKESDPGSRDRLKELEKELAQLEEESAALTARWQREKERLGEAQKLQEQLDQARIELDQAQRRGDLARAGELAYGVIPDLERKLAAAPAEADATMLREEVTAEDIAAIVSRWTGVPVDKMLAGERGKRM